MLFGVIAIVGFVGGDSVDAWLFDWANGLVTLALGLRNTSITLGGQDRLTATRATAVAKATSPAQAAPLCATRPDITEKAMSGRKSRITDNGFIGYSSAGAGRRAVWPTPAEAGGGSPGRTG